MRGRLIVALVVLLVLPGCFSKGGSSGTSSSSTSGTGQRSTATVTVTTHPANATNRAPSGALMAHLGNGTAAGNATFMLSGSDPDGDPLNWTLAFGDGNATHGSALPTNVTHAYKAHGLVNVTFLLSDGRANATYSALLNLTGASLVVSPDVKFTGNLMGGPDVIVGYNSNVPGSTATNKVTVPANSAKMTVTLTYSDPGGQAAVDEDLDITDPAGTVTKAHASGPEPPQVFAAPLAGSWSISVHLYSGTGQNSYTIVVHFG